jgi:peptide/nickel transport system ATP-binding protein
MSDLVQVSGLNVLARDSAGNEAAIVKNVGFSIPRGDVLALIGESGSGKTTIALALMGYARSGCRISGGSVRIDDAEILALDHERLLNLRGGKVAYIAQSAAAAFNPSRTIMHQVTESALTHGLMARDEAEEKAIELFRSLALPDPDHIGERYPHQVSGGQLQRLMAAMALITDPALVILDEPTTALDVTTQIEVLRAFKEAIRERGATAVYVSHDLAVVAQMADQIVVLNRGEIRESGTTEQILHAPADAYTKELMAAARPTARLASAAEPSSTRSPPPLLEIRDLAAGYGKRNRQGLPANLVLNDINLKIERGATLGVIGESGSGKSTLARVIAGLVAPVRGSVVFDGEPLAPDLKTRTRDQFRRIQIVFQSADTALNPAHTIGRILARPLEFYRGLRGAERDQRIGQLLEQVRLPASIANRRSSELSGGQKQRINLARALAAEPDLILCDEVTSALDTVVGAAILDLMAELRRELNVSYMFISHDISTVRAICDDIVVLYAGRKVESGSRQTLAAPPFHPYTDLLISSVPELRRGWLEQIAVRRTLPEIGATASELRASPDLCTFLHRCPARINGVCNVEPPLNRIVRNDKEILCHHTDAELERLFVRERALEEASR